MGVSAEPGRPSGRTVTIRGSVVDVRFEGQLPAVGTRLETGADGSAVLEVVGHLDDRTVRTVALTPTRGLARGEEVTDTGHHFEVRVGRATAEARATVDGPVPPAPRPSPVH